MADRNVSVPPTEVACAACIARLAAAEYQLLPETDADVVAEHLSECPDCRLFGEQLDTTREVLAATPAPERRADLAEVLEETRSELTDGRIEQSLGRLYRVADALGVEDADELVQQTLLDAISRGATVDSGALTDSLIRAAAGKRSDPTESLEEAAEPGSAAYDPDGETAELFYPAFYEEGPDVGRFVESPNVWGHVFHFGPDEEAATIELFEVTDAAIDELPEVERRLITLVDVDSVPLEDAARALRVDGERAALALNKARIHVRGAIDQYLDNPDAQD
jgi:DNA-directed RNA polymerase specialized sigma24 family protein